MHLDEVDLTVTPSFEMTGSMLAGTAEHRLVSIDTHLDIRSALDATVVRELVEQAERMCFVLDALQRPHAVSSRTTLNDVAL